MKVAELLRSLADMICSIESEQASPPPVPVVVNVNNGSSTPSNNDTQTALDTDKFVPPLQQKLEIMKRMAGIPTNFTAVAADEDEPFEG